MARHNKIHLGPATENCPQTEEAIPSVAVTPGALVYRNGANFALLTAALSVQGRQAYIASENFVQGRDVDDANPVNESMIAYIPLPRERYAALLATGQNITALDTPLKVSSTAGVLDIGTPGTDRIVAYAREIFNNTSGSSQLIAIRPAE